MNSVDRQLRSYSDRYSKTLKPLRVDFRASCSSWPWAKRSDAFTHLIHKYPAKIFPYIPIFFLSSDEWTSQDDIVLDPFAGTGTVLLESIVHPHNRRHCLGCDVNPLARLIAKSKTTPIPVRELQRTADRLIHKIRISRKAPQAPAFANVDFWFSKQVQAGLSKILACLDEIGDSDQKDFFLVCLSSIIRDVSFADPKIAPPVILNAKNFDSNPKRKKEVEKMINAKKRAVPLHYFKRAIDKNILRMSRLVSIKEVLLRQVKAEIIWDDARTIRWGLLKERGIIDKTNSAPIENGSIGLVITSPPYINAQKYLRTTKFELRWLRLVNENELVELDRNFLGTERIFNDEYNHTQRINVESADRIIEEIFEIDRKRAGIVSRYFMDMKMVFQQIHKLLKEEGRLVLVVGNNTISGRIVENHRILSDIASAQGDFDVEMVLVDGVRSRGMITKRHESGGLVLDDWVVVLKRG